MRTLALWLISLVMLGAHRAGAENPGGSQNGNGLFRNVDFPFWGINQTVLKNFGLEPIAIAKAKAEDYRQRLSLMSNQERAAINQQIADWGSLLQSDFNCKKQEARLDGLLDGTQNPMPLISFHRGNGSYSDLERCLRYRAKERFIAKNRKGFDPQASLEERLSSFQRALLVNEYGLSGLIAPLPLDKEIVAKIKPKDAALFNRLVRSEIEVAFKRISNKGIVPDTPTADEARSQQMISSQVHEPTNDQNDQDDFLYIFQQKRIEADQESSRISVGGSPPLPEPLEPAKPVKKRPRSEVP